MRSRSPRRGGEVVAVGSTLRNVPRMDPDEVTPAGRRGGAARTTSYDQRTLVSLFVGVLIAYAVVALFRAAAETLTAIAVGILLALAVDPLVAWLKNRTGCGRGLAVTVVSVVLLAAVGALLVFVGPPAVRQASEFGRDVETTVQELYELPVVGDRLEEADAATAVMNWLEALPREISSTTISDVARRVFGGLAAFLLVVMVGSSVLVDGEAIVGRARRLVPGEYRERVDDVGRIFYRTISRYFAGSLLMAVMSGTWVLTIGLILGVPLAPVAAIWAMLTDVIPQVGGLLGGAFFVALAATVSVPTAVLATGLFIAYMSFQNYVIQPTIVGKAVDLSPPATMIAIFIGAAAAGVPGALVATPLLGTAKAVYLDLRGAGVAAQVEAAS